MKHAISEHIFEKYSNIKFHENTSCRNRGTESVAMTGCFDYGSELSRTTIVFSRWTLLNEFSRLFQNKLSKNVNWIWNF